MHSRNLCLLFMCAFFCVLDARSGSARIPDDVDHWSFWDWAGEPVSVIDCHDGNESFSTALALPHYAGAGWVLAIPARAEYVTACWRDNLPKYSGRILKSVLHERLDWILKTANATQLYPLVYNLFTPSLGRAAETASHPLDVTSGDATCLIRPADSPAQFRQLIADTAIDLSDTDIARMADFADGHHSFVIIKTNSTPINDPRKNPSSTDLPAAGSSIWELSKSAFQIPYVELNFPSQQPIIPSYAIAKIGSTALRTNIVVLGYVVPPASFGHDPMNPNYAFHLDHFRGYASRFQEPYYEVSIPPGTIVAYSRLFLQCYTPPEQLALSPQVGADFRALDYGFTTYASTPALIALGLLWTTLTCYITGGLTGLLFRKRWHPSAKLGLWNLATLIAMRLRLTKHPEIAHPILYTIVFSLVFLAFNYAASFLLTFFLGSYWPGWS